MGVVVICGDGERFLGSSGRSERTGGGTVRTEVGEAEEGVALVGRDAKGRSMGAGLEGVVGARAEADDETSCSGGCDLTGESRRDGEAAEEGDGGAAGTWMEGLDSLSSVEKDTVLRRFFRGGRMGEDGRGQGGDGGR